MTRVYNDPTNFREEIIIGFAAAYGRYVRRVEGASGFTRLSGPLAGKVSIVVGGGSGHYPSYAGIVGPGLADGCVLGDVFTSPSAEQVYRVAAASAGNDGVILAFGNYAGDRLNFAAAQERLIADGIDTRIVYVTDDIASASPEERDSRRGIAGTVAVYKIGGAAAETGLNLDEVERIMAKAKDASFSFGVGFAGCTLPGQSSPLFDVEAGRMELGLGIHGEPGIKTVDWMPATELAKTLVDAVLAERPAGADGRAAVVVNGLGATKYEELFVLFGAISDQLLAEGVTLVLPEVGELVTSLDMAGCSLSITWLDDELEKLWCDPVDTAAFRRGAVSVSSFETLATGHSTAGAEKVAAGPASAVSIAAADVARIAIEKMTASMVENEQLLGDMDAVAGDGDHGIGMVRGFRAASDAIGNVTDVGVSALLREAGDAFGDKAGGTSGILWGILLSTLGDELGDNDEVHGADLARAVRRAINALQTVGKAQPGDKTMLDALWPFIDTFDAGLASGTATAQAWSDAAAVAVTAALDTAPMSPKIGRARPLAERSVGTPDPGATSMGLLLTVVAEVLNA